MVRGRSQWYRNRVSVLGAGGYKTLWSRFSFLVPYSLILLIAGAILCQALIATMWFPDFRLKTKGVSDLAILEFSSEMAGLYGLTVELELNQASSGFTMSSSQKRTSVKDVFRVSRPGPKRIKMSDPRDWDSVKPGYSRDSIIYILVARKDLTNDQIFFRTRGKMDEFDCLVKSHSVLVQTGGLYGSGDEYLVYLLLIAITGASVKLTIGLIGDWLKKLAPWADK